MNKRLFLLFLLIAVAMLTSCKNNSTFNSKVTTNNTVSETRKTTIVKETTTITNTTIKPVDFDTIKFEDLTVPYDGEIHQLVVEGVDERCTTSISPSKKYKSPGVYEYTLTVTYGNEKREYKATLTIEKLVATVEVNENQTFYLSDGPATPAYTTNYDDYTADSTVYYTEPGDYTTTLDFSGSNIYTSCESKTVNMHVEYSRSGYNAYDEYNVLVNADSSAVSLYVADSTKNQSLYTYKLEDCDLTKQGIYKANIVVYDRNTLEKVESFRTIVTVDNEENSEFKEYEDDMFVYFLGGDQLSINIMTENYESFGLEHGDNTWYKYEKYTDEQYSSDLNEIENLRTELEKFKDADLSYSQIATYKTIEGNIVYYEKFISNKANALMKQNYVDQYGGYCADFPTYMEAYTIRRLEDIEDIISYVSSSYDGFMSYMDYIKDRAEAGYGLSETTLTKMNEYLDGVIEKGDDYYLINILKIKVIMAKDLLSLTDEQVTSYNLRIEDAMKNKFLKAHTDLKEAIENYIAQEKEDGYLANFKEGYLSIYTNGSDLYEAMLRDTLGMYDMSMEDYGKYLDEQVSTYLSIYLNLYPSFTSNVNRIMDGKRQIVSSDDPEEILKYLKEFAKTIVPEIECEPTVSFTYMDPTVTDNTTTLAYYMKSAIDDTSFKEYIHLNGESLGDDKLSTIKTIAHEGYPGHLYAYVYSKESDSISNFVKANTSTGHAEAWAKYVEIALSRYIGEKQNSDDWDIAMEASIAWDICIYALYARLDLGINYEGWNVTKVARYLGKCGLNSDAAKEVYQTLIEVPSQYAPYGYGMALFNDIHESAKEELGNFYNEVDYNNCLLEHGWVGLDMVKEYSDTYIENQKYLNHID